MPRVCFELVASALVVTLLVRSRAMLNAAVVFALIVSFLLTRLPVQLPFDEARVLAQQYYATSSEDNQPLKGKIAIVTGSTSGLGQCLASELYQVRN
jgi:hypothetical protein